MASVGERCLQAFVGLLADRTAVPVERNRDSPVDLTRFERYLLVEDGPQTADAATYGVTLYRRDLTVIGLVAGAQAVERADALYAEVVRAIGSDAQLGGLAIDCHEGEYRPGTVEVEFAGKGAGFSLDYTIAFATRDDDPAVEAGA